MTLQRPTTLEEERDFQVIDHRTLHALCEQLRVLTPQVVPPVHVFDLPPQAMSGLFSVAWITRQRTLHRCVIAYRTASSISAERRVLAKLLLSGGLDQTEGRIEIGANTGDLLRYFLPNSSRPVRHEERRPERCQVDWLSAGDRGDGPKQVWFANGAAGVKVAGISAAGVHYLVRLSAGASSKLQVARERLGCGGIEEVRQGGPLFRDIMGEWEVR